MRTTRGLVLCVAIVGLAGSAFAQDVVMFAPNGSAAPEVGGCGTVIYDTTRVANQGAEVTAAANGPATSLSDRIVLGGSERFICGISIDVFTLASLDPFDLTLSLWTDCTTSGAGNTPCGDGTGTMIAGSAVTVTNIVPPALGTIFAVTFPYALLDLSGEADDTISVSLNVSRADVYWRINETPTVGSIPAGEPATSFVERCGSTAANNGCQRNFGVNNNFGMTIGAEATPVTLEQFSIE